MLHVFTPPERWAKRFLSWSDAQANRLYTWHYNPLYHSGAIVVLLLAIILVTGLYLLFFYRIGSPYESIEAITDRIFLGGFSRTLHRYASDAAIIASAIHAFRLFAQGRSWGPRALAWVSGVALVALILICGWTGYVMVWDTQGLLLAREGARLLDAIPLFAEPIGRTFVGDGELPSAFFFLNLFLHVAIPVGLAALLWLHTSRVGRPRLMPPRGLSWGVGIALAGLTLLWPIGVAERADLFRFGDTVPLDLFYNGWLPISAAMAPLTVWFVILILTVVAVGIPWLVRPRARRVSAPASTVDTRLCDGCEQCYLDCPYEAITMVDLAESRTGVVADVNPDLCVGCAICAASCAPMAVGPPGRTGRDQLKHVKRYILDRHLGDVDVVVVACQQGAGGFATDEVIDGAPVFRLNCTGSMHSSVVEYLVRSGVGGVLIVACPGRDCTNREGPMWLVERLYHDREAELQPRVDRSRIHLVHASLGETREVRDALVAFRAQLHDVRWELTADDHESVSRIERDFIREGQGSP